jgi:hypothetical protein
MHDENEGRRPDQANRCKILAGIVAKIRINARSHRKGGGVSLPQRVAIRYTLCDLAHCDRASCARAILHDDLLAQHPAHLFGGNPRDDVSATACGERHDQRDRARRIGLSYCPLDIRQIG